MKRVGLIGCGAIGRPVARALLAGTAGAHTLTAVLANEHALGVARDDGLERGGAIVGEQDRYAL